MRQLGSYLLLLALVACGGGGGGPGSGSGSNPVLVDGVASKAPLRFATMRFHVLEPHGTKGALLGSALTFSGGQFTFVSLTKPASGFVYVESLDGSYVDESTGATEMLSGNDSLCAVFPNDPTNIDVVAVTPLTTIAAKRIMALAAAGTPLQLAYASTTTSVAQQFGLEDIASTFPADPTDADATRTASRQQRQYGLVLAGLSELAWSMSTRAIDLTAALAADGADGTINAKMGEAFVEVPNTKSTVAPWLPLHALQDLQASINAIAGRTIGNHQLPGQVIAASPVPLGVPNAGVLRFAFTALPAWVSGVPGTAALPVEGGTPPYVHAIQAGGALPPGFALQGNQITGQSTLSSGTTHSISPPFMLEVTDSAVPPNVIRLPLVIQVTSPAPAIQCTSGVLQAQEGVQANLLIAAMAGMHGPFYFAGDTLRNGVRPPGLTIEPVGSGPGGVQGWLSGVPGANSAGLYSFGVCGVDLIGNQSCCQVTVAVAPPPGGGGGGGGGGVVTDFDGIYTGEYTGCRPSGAGTPSGACSGGLWFSGTMPITIQNGQVSGTGTNGETLTGTITSASGAFDGTWNNNIGTASFQVTAGSWGASLVSGSNTAVTESVSMIIY